MSRLNLLVASADGARFYAALETAMALTALGREVRIFLQAEAAALVKPPIRYAGDGARRAVGQPDLAAMLGEVLAAGVELSLCQTGLEMAGLAAQDIDPHLTPTGLVGWLTQTRCEDPMWIF